MEKRLARLYRVRAPTVYKGSPIGYIRVSYYRFHSRKSPQMTDEEINALLSACLVVQARTARAVVSLLENETLSEEDRLTLKQSVVLSVTKMAAEVDRIRPGMGGGEEILKVFSHHSP